MLHFSGFVDIDKIENYSEHRGKFVLKGRGTAFKTAVKQMDDYISHPNLFQSNALANRVQIKTERDVEHQLNVKREKIDVVKQHFKASKSQKLSSNASWQQEKQNLVQQIVSLKAESQNIHLQLKNKELECTSLSSKNQALELQIGVQISELNGLKKTLENMSANQAKKTKENQKIVSDLSLEIKLLKARSKQLQTGIDDHAQLKDKANHSATENDEYEVEKILERKKQKGVWFYNIRWKGYDWKYDTWEKESNLQCPEILNAFKLSIAEDKK